MKNLGVRNPDEFANLPLNWLLMLIDQEARAADEIAGKKPAGGSRSAKFVDDFAKGAVNHTTPDGVAIKHHGETMGVARGTLSEASFAKQLAQIQNGEIVL